MCRIMEELIQEERKEARDEAHEEGREEAINIFVQVLTRLKKGDSKEILLNILYMKLFPLFMAMM